MFYEHEMLGFKDLPIMKKKKEYKTLALFEVLILWVLNC